MSNSRNARGDGGMSNARKDRTARRTLNKFHLMISSSLARPFFVRRHGGVSIVGGVGFPLNDSTFSGTPIFYEEKRRDH